jgi:hypothetical protein
MQTSNADQESRSKDSEWVLLGECSLSKFLLDPENGDQITAGPLSQIVRELGIPVKGVENIETTLRSFAREALAHFKPGKVELPGRIRIFCQKKMIDDANSVKISRLDNVEQAMEHAQIIHPSGTKMNEGWGYYVIERGRDFASIPCKESCRVVELYVYKEGK